MNKLYPIIISSLCLALLTSCYEKEEGCLDTMATNFDPEADEDCCCTYPQLKLIWDYYLEDTIFSAGDTIRPGSGPDFGLLSFRIMGGAVELQTDNGPIRVIDTEVMRIVPPTGEFREERTDDAFLLSPTKFNHTIGSFILEGQVNELSFEWAPIDQYQGVQPDDFASSHPLPSADAQGMWVDSLWSFASFQYVLDNDTNRVFLSPGEAINFSFPIDTVISAVTPLDVRLRLNLSDLFDGIDLNSPDLEKIWSQWRQNAPNAVVLVE